MLCVGPGKGMEESEVPLADVAIASLWLLMKVIVFATGLKIMVYFSVGDTTIITGSPELPSKLMGDVARTSCMASIICTTGSVEVPTGSRAFVTNARKLKPLKVCVLLVLELLLPHEMIATLATMSAAKPITVLFKPATPNRLRDKDFDARKRIITEQFRGASRYPHTIRSCKTFVHLVFSMKRHFLNGL